MSPDLCEIIVLKFAFLAMEITSKVSDKVPIWFGFTKILFADFSLIPFSKRLVLVTNKSSPTICTLFPIALVIFFQDSQSSSANGSSIDLIG